MGRVWHSAISSRLFPRFAIQASESRMITGLEGAYLLCNLGILVNGSFIKLSEGMLIPWGAGALGRLGGCGEGISAKPARTRAVEAANFGALDGAWAASAGEGAVFPKLAQNLGNQTNPTRISYQVNNQTGWDGLAGRLSGIWNGSIWHGKWTWWS